MEAFDIYFASIVSMNLHPGFNRPDSTSMTLREAAELAAEMVKIREEYKPCPG